MPIAETAFPTALDDATTLVEVRDQGQTTLTADINATTLTLPVANTSTLPPTGIATIAGEQIPYSSKTLTQINAVSRGAFTALGGQAAASHTSGNAVEILDNAATHKVLVDALIAVETLLGINGANFQPRDTELTALAGLTSAADRLPYFDGAGTAALATFTAAGRAIIDDADAAAQRATLGFDEAVQDVVGALVADSATIDATYNDAGAVESLIVIPDTIPLTNLSDVAITGQQVGDRLVAASSTSWVNAKAGVGDLGKYYSVTDDFLGGNNLTGSTSVGEIGWIHFQTGGGIIVPNVAFKSERHAGTVRLVCPAVAGGLSGIATPNGDTPYYWNSIVEMEWIIAPDNGVTGQILVCITDNSASFTNGLIVLQNTTLNSNRWVAYSMSGGVSSTKQNTTILAAVNTWYQILMKKTGATTADVTVNQLNASGGVAATSTVSVTGIPSVPMVALTEVFASDSAGHGVSIDYFRATLDPAVVTRGT